MRKRLFNRSTHDRLNAIKQLRHKGLGMQKDQLHANFLHTLFQCSVQVQQHPLDDQFLDIRLFLLAGHVIALCHWVDRHRVDHLGQGRHIGRWQGQTAHALPEDDLLARSCLSKV